ncbi:MAG: hypothetical protein K0S55_1607, partial [Clostridia bacterium]|nr:hypothetical protein [Clostridia bacterium]
MDQFDLTENVNTLFQSLENFTQKEGVIGKPVSQGDKTFLPIVSISVGYGGGNASMGMGQTNGSFASKSTESSSGTGALGLGAKLNTEAVILIDNQNVSLLTLSMPNGSQLIDKIPQIIRSEEHTSELQSLGEIS